MPGGLPKPPGLECSAAPRDGNGFFLESLGKKLHGPVSATRELGGKSKEENDVRRSRGTRGWTWRAPLSADTAPGQTRRALRRPLSNHSSSPVDFCQFRHLVDLCFDSV